MYSNSGHTALVTACDGTTVTVVQGNWGSKVAKTTYSINDTKVATTNITGYVTPLYSYLVNSVSGDFDGDGDSEFIGMYGGTGATMELVLWDNMADAFHKSRGTVVCSTPSFTASRTAGRMVSGDFDGDGKDEIGAFYDYGNGIMRLWQFKRISSSSFTGYSVCFSDSYDVNAITNRIVSGDFDGDGNDEIGAFFDYGNGIMRLWQFKYIGGTEFSSYSVLYSDDFDVTKMDNRIVSGDFDGDGKDEIGAFYDYGNSVMRLWRFKYTDRTNYSAYPVLYSDDFDVRRITNCIVTGDYDGDGKEEIALFFDYGDEVSKLWRIKETNATNYSCDLVLYLGWFDSNCIAGRLFTHSHSNGKDEIRALYRYAEGSYGLWNFYEKSASDFEHSRIW